MVILWYNATTGRGYLLRVDFTFVPDAIGAEVVIDGEVVDTLHMLRRQLINGIRVPNGEHVVLIQSESCLGRPLTVVPGSREKTVSLFVHSTRQTVENQYRCVFFLRRR
jgi:hypothetical protein